MFCLSTARTYISGTASVFLNNFIFVLAVFAIKELVCIKSGYTTNNHCCYGVHSYISRVRAIYGIIRYFIVIQIYQSASVTSRNITNDFIVFFNVSAGIFMWELKIRTF